MKKLKKKISKSFLHQFLVYLSFVVLGLILVLAFSFFAVEDNFNVYDHYISVKINGTYMLNIRSLRNTNELHYYSENPTIATINEK